MNSTEIEQYIKSLENLEKRVRNLEDLENIKTITRHYVTSLSEVNWDELINCFTENAIVEIGIAGSRQGRAAITQLFKNEIGTRHIGKEHVFVVHPEITLKGDKAEGKWIIYFMFTEASHIKTMEWVHGPYQMEYAKENGKWKINHLKWTQTLGPIPYKLIEIYENKEYK